MEINCHGMNMEGNCVRRLFGGPVEAWKIAGLPHPGTEALTYMLEAITEGMKTPKELWLLC